MNPVELSVKVTLNASEDEVVLSFAIEDHPNVIVDDTDRLTIAEEAINVLKYYVNNETK